VKPRLFIRKVSVVQFTLDFNYYVQKIITTEDTEGLALHREVQGRISNNGLPTTSPKKSSAMTLKT